MSEAPQLGPNSPCELFESLHGAHKATSELLCNVVDQIGLRHSARIDFLIRSGAWTDAVLALIELELPQWRPRRIVYDDGEWHCALSRQRELPDWLDQAVEYRHPDLSLAMLGALIDARRAGAEPARTSVPGVPRVAWPLDAQLCCDNFG